MSQLFNAKRDKSSCPASKRGGKNGPRNKSRSRNTRRLCLEGLEGRNLLSADASPLPMDIGADSPFQAIDDRYVMTSNQQLGSGVLANDIHAAGDTITAVLMEPPAHGTLVMQADGRFTYKPDPGFAGTDRFAYGAADGRSLVVPTIDGLTGGVPFESGLAIVTILVEGANDAPVAVDDSYTAHEDEPLIIGAGGLLENDTDVDGDTFAAVLVDAPAHGTVVLTSDGSLQYTPNPNFHGTDSFTYRASDGQAESDPATVNITVTPIDLAIQLEVSGEAFGADAGVVWAGATFWVNAYVQDRRDAPQGVVGGAVDILFDPLVVLPTGNVVYGEDFSIFQQGRVESASGEIDEAGAISVATNTGARALAPFLAWEFTIVGGLDVPTAVPQVAFAVEPGEGAATITPASFALIGSGDPVAWDCVALGAAEVDLYYGDFNGDRLVNHFDLALWQSHADQTVDSLGYDRLYDLDNDGVIGEADLDLLLAAMYRPAAPPSGVTADAEASEASEETSPRPSDEPLETSEILLAIDGLFARDPLWEVG